MGDHDIIACCKDDESQSECYSYGAGAEERRSQRLWREAGFLPYQDEDQRLGGNDNPYPED